MKSNIIGFGCPNCHHIMSRYFYGDDNNPPDNINARYDFIQEFNDGFIDLIVCSNCKNTASLSEWIPQER